MPSRLREAAVKSAIEEARRALAHKDPKMSAEEAQAQLAMSLAQLSALERLRKNLNLHDDYADP